MAMTLTITPLELEFTFLSQALIDLGFKVKESNLEGLEIHKFDELNLCIGKGGHGKVQFAIQTQFLLNKYPEATRVFCAGAAGGISNTVSTFDVVAGEKTIEHDYTLRFVEKKLPEFHGNVEMLKKLRKIGSTDFDLHFGTIASGDEDIVSSERAKEIHEKTSGLAVAWEGAGGARASKLLNLPFVELRAITDMASNSAPIDFKKNLQQSMQNIGITLKSFQLN